MNAIIAVRGLEQGTTESDLANDEFSHVLWSQREHLLAIQHVELMIQELAKSGSKDRGRQAILLGRMVCSDKRS